MPNAHSESEAARPAPKEAPVKEEELSPVLCHLDGFDENELRGWALDRSAPGQPVVLHVVVDGQEVAQLLCNGMRQDVAAAGLGTGLAGYHWRPDAKFLDGQPHRLTFRDTRRRLVRMETSDGTVSTYLGFSIKPIPVVSSFVDGVRNGAFEGWVLRSDRGEPPRGNCLVRITCDGVPIGFCRAGRYRGDVGKALSADPNNGFQFVPPDEYRKGYPQEFRFHLMPEEIELNNSPVTTQFVTDQHEAHLIDIVDHVDRLHREITTLRRQIRELMPKPRLSLDTYETWYAAYARDLARRVASSRLPGVAQPLVSVVCPVYRPALAEFEQAVRSVIGQTYPNWELILVDDGSKSPELTALITRLCKQDNRIKAYPRRKNGGISDATNDALKVAGGEWVAFFDHDDLLVDVALECMMDEAFRRPGAQVMYSDEDKVDEGGHFLGPAFKPAWTHRLVLGVNYVCHLLMARRDALEKAGPLDRRMNGAQDHDLILRLAEVVPADAILHVPEILYHWRITASSTASDIGAKPYAIKAGLDSVRAHLQRLGRRAEVRSRGDITLYDVRWQLDRHPPVTIIIPFKDQLEITEQCVDRLLAITDYDAFDVLLVDNWSTAAGLASFAHRVTADNRVRIMRVEEPFNYSRLNNLAAANTQAEFLVLMNNDMIVANDDWLLQAMGEALADDKVAAVGGRFSYPNGTLQHAGVALGIGGVAGHVHVGIPEGEGGYAGRASFAQEMSAVTAAGMLLRHSAFDEVGGFDEKELQVAFNDIDLCLKLRRAGYRVVYTPEFRAVHHESLSRGDDVRPVQESRFFRESEVMKERWGQALENDPFYNKHFSRDRQAYYDLNQPGG